MRYKDTVREGRRYRHGVMTWTSRNIREVVRALAQYHKDVVCAVNEKDHLLINYTRRDGIRFAQVIKPGREFVSHTTRVGGGVMRDVVAKVSDMAKEHAIKLMELHLTRQQWEELIDDIDSFPPIMTGYMFVDGIKVVCPEIHEQWRQPTRIAITWDGANIEEVIATARGAFKVEKISFDADERLEMILYRRCWDVGGNERLIRTLDKGDELIIELQPGFE